MSRPTIQKYADNLPLGEYSFVPLLGRTLEYDATQIDRIIEAAKTMHGGARNDFVKVVFYTIGLINRHSGTYSHSLKQFAEELSLNYTTVQKHIDKAIELKLFNRSQVGNSFFWGVFNIFIHFLIIWNIFLDLSQGSCYNISIR